MKKNEPLEFENEITFDEFKFIDEFEIIDGITDEDRQWMKDVNLDRIKEQGL